MPKTNTPERRAGNLIGERLRTAREAKRFWSQSKLAARLPADVKIDRASINKIEKQKRGVRDYEVVELAKVLGVGVEWLLGLTNEGGPA